MNNKQLGIAALVYFLIAVGLYFVVEPHVRHKVLDNCMYPKLFMDCLDRAPKNVSDVDVVRQCRAAAYSMATLPEDLVMAECK